MTPRARLVLFIVGLHLVAAGVLFAAPGWSGTLSLLGAGKPAAVAGGGTGKLLRADGVSYILRTDGTSKICRSGGC